MDLDTQLCVTRSTTVDDVTAACQALFYPGAPEDDTKTPPVPAKPADARLQVCIDSNMATGVCTKYPDEQEGSFRTPSLINVAMTGPYFHTGLYNTLRDVVDALQPGRRSRRDVRGHQVAAHPAARPDATRRSTTSSSSSRP